MNFFQHECYLHARVPRIKTSGKEGIKTFPVPWARSESGFTLLFEAMSMLLIESEMPVKKVAKVMKVYDNRLWRVFNYWVSKAFKSDEQQNITSIGIDETSSKKGHKYVTVAVDMKVKRVIFATPGKDSKCIDRLNKHLTDKGCSSENIKQVSMDMSSAFISGVEKNFPSAEITFDKFHITKLMNEAMDSVRKMERTSINELKGHKYIFLKNDINLSDKQKESKFYFLNTYSTLSESYRLKELFNDFWNMQTEDDAAGYLSYWCDCVEDSKIQPFIKAANTIRKHWKGILNYFNSNLNNAILEGINSKIQLAKKRARGYRNIDNFINMIYLIAGKLKFDYPLYST
jgi:transposase